MNRFQLLLNEYEPVTFYADFHQLKAQLNASYLAFTTQHNITHAVLYVHHSIHSWCQVCHPDGTYPIINNPLTLDAKTLTTSIRYTLALADQRPTLEQKQKEKAMALQVERDTHAKQQRSHFHIINNDKND